MSYIAHAAVRLHINYRHYTQDVWNPVTLSDGTEIQWRLRSDKILEIASQPIEDKKEAISLGKRLYTSLLLQLLWLSIHIDDAGCQTYAHRFYNEEMDGDREEEMPDCLLVWKKNCSGGGIGLDIYEADTIDELDKKTDILELSIEQFSDSDRLGKINPNGKYFSYSPVIQEHFTVMTAAELLGDTGLQMTLYCGILEKLAGEQYKEQDVLDEIDKLIAHVNESELDQKSKEELTGYLRNGKKQSSRRKIKELCSRYARESYEGYDTDKIIQEAYGARSIFSHEGSKENMRISAGWYIKWVVLDVIRGYYHE